VAIFAKIRGDDFLARVTRESVATLAEKDSFWPILIQTITAVLSIAINTHGHFRGVDDDVTRVALPEIKTALFDVRQEKVLVNAEAITKEIKLADLCEFKAATS
jgi:hypothetical protein